MIALEIFGYFVMGLLVGLIMQHSIGDDENWFIVGAVFFLWPVASVILIIFGVGWLISKFGQKIDDEIDWWKYTR